jgi:hypothetical protein
MVERVDELKTLSDTHRHVIVFSVLSVVITHILSLPPSLSLSAIHVWQRYEEKKQWENRCWFPCLHGKRICWASAMARGTYFCLLLAAACTGARKLIFIIYCNSVPQREHLFPPLVHGRHTTVHNTTPKHA